MILSVSPHNFRNTIAVRIESGIEVITINVLRGDMSLVGPRAHAIAMKAGDRLYHDAVEQYLHRHRVKPGITGWAQVNGLRGEVDTLEKARARVAHDLHYIDHWSPWLDLKILLMTAGVLASRDSAY